jgi:hypothetical protein
MHRGTTIGKKPEICRLVMNLTKNVSLLAGGKRANLLEMTHANILVREYKSGGA